MATVIIEQGDGKSLNEGVVTLHPGWFIGNVFTEKAISEILDDHFKDGYVVKHGTPNHYVLYKGVSE